MKHLARVALVLGLAMTLLIVKRVGFEPIRQLLMHAGWLLPWLVPLHVLPLLLDVLGWRRQIVGSVRLCRLLLIASIREAVNRLLPVASVGGEIAGVHLLSRESIPVQVAAASVIVELVLTLLAQTLFIAFGVLLLRMNGSIPGRPIMLLWLAVIVPLPMASYWLVRSGLLFKGLRYAAVRFRGNAGAVSPLSESWELMDQTLRILTLAQGELLATAAWQFAGLLAGCLETWFALSWLGCPVSPAAAVTIDSIALAVRGIAFVVPGAWGVQEAGMVGIGHLLGIGGDIAVSLSLVKRLREVSFGLGAFCLWHWTASRLGTSAMMESQKRSKLETLAQAAVEELRERQGRTGRLFARLNYPDGIRFGDLEAVRPPERPARMASASFPKALWQMLQRLLRR